MGRVAIALKQRTVGMTIVSTDQNSDSWSQVQFPAVLALWFCHRRGFAKMAILHLAVFCILAAHSAGAGRLPEEGAGVTRSYWLTNCRFSK